MLGLKKTRVNKKGYWDSHIYHVDKLDKNQSSPLVYGYDYSIMEFGCQINNSPIRFSHTADPIWTYNLIPYDVLLCIYLIHSTDVRARIQITKLYGQLGYSLPYVHVLNENVLILIKFSLKFVPNGSVNNISALVQIMARRRPGDKPLSEPMIVCLPTYICVTRPQYVILLWLVITNAAGEFADCGKSWWRMGLLQGMWGHEVFMNNFTIG